ncbi:MAG: DUF2723 domain-containing protein [Bacteroidaceae bacterium]|nr:DUF2723 domain-containing protein [Bacteroidaceae bacterium]
MKTYKIINNVTGWIVFAIAAFTYCSTIEPTASFWDCPEFISTAAKLEVGHPPGAPFFMLVGNLFSQFASDATQIAKMVNIMSALLSAGCILFLFWTVTHLAKKLICEDDEQLTVGKIIAIMASGIGGALIYTWSDTFWFSAVEGEVYAFSSFLTALVFWLILKWENKADEAGSDRWLILIAYLVGLSIGVHLLNLLCIPAMVLVYYYKRSKNPTGRGSLIAVGISAVIIAAVLYGVVPGIMKVGGWFELLFVNMLGMSFNTGLYVYLILLVACLVWAIIESTKAVSKTRMNIAFLLSVAMLGIPFYSFGWRSALIGIVILAILACVVFMYKKITSQSLNTILLCMALMVVGYSSYALIVIRSTANPPMDQNSPEDVFTLEEYLGREQYGDRPLFYGPTFRSKAEIIQKGDKLMYNTSKGAPVYQRKEKASADEKDEYEVIREKFDYVYPSDQCMFFPRIYEERDAAKYISWLSDVHYKTVNYTIPGQGSHQLEIPTQYDNLRYFLSYQLNFMYWRYFMWNFAGRQNDLQGLGETEHGNWITGFKFLDDLRLGNQDLLPTELKENKGHNVFYCLPLLLGIIGLLWQAFRGKKGIQQFWVVCFLFFMTGIAIVLYLNQTPGQPRERDYAYAGSFYAFAIWCGLGVMAIYAWLEKFLNKKMQPRLGAIVASVIAVIPAIAVPLQMVSQTWDDHDRSGRYMCRDFGLNYLETIPHDGVIYTNGDNDTFPLWYNEDTEGNRTDVRVCNLSYLQTDWYIDQMKRPAFEGDKQSTPLPISWTRLQYVSGKNEMTEVNPPLFLGGREITMKELVQTMYSQDPETARAIWGDEPFELKNAIKKFLLKEDIPAQFADMVKDLPSCLPSDTLYVTVNKEAVRKSGMMIPNDSIPDKMVISLAGQDHILKNFTMMLEMIAQSEFKRPLYVSTTVGPQNYGNLWHHFVQEGLAWRITPFTFEENMPQQAVVDSEKMFDNMMNKYSYGNLKQPDLYLDETTMRMCWTHRRWFAHLITTLLDEGKTDKALQALEKCDVEIPEYNVPYKGDNGGLEIAQGFIACGKIDRGVELLNAMEKTSREYITFYASLGNARFAAAWRDCRSEIYAIAEIQRSFEKLGDSQEAGSKASMYKKQAEDLMAYLNHTYSLLASRAESLGINP